MKTYISKLIDGYFCIDKVDEAYWEGYVGSTLEDFYDGKWVLLSDEQALFHEEHPDATVLQVWDMNIPVYTRTVEDAKAEKLLQIDYYDNSLFVNAFDISVGDNTITTWIAPDQRANYKNSIDAAKLMGLDEVHPIFNGTQLTIPTTTAEMALAQILLYADRCYIVTELHKAAVNALTTIEDVDAYDHTAGYPEKLTFNL